MFADDDLAAEIAPGGRLEQMVSLGRQLPVTWVIDPDLLASVDAMTKPYRVRSGDTTVAGTNQELAKKWLTSLEAAVSEGKVVALPFGDPDLASIAHRGKTVSGTLSHLQTASEVAGMTVETILHLKPSTDFAWPVDGAVDPSIVDVATSAGAHNVIARSDSSKRPGTWPTRPPPPVRSAAAPRRSSPTHGSPRPSRGDMGNASSSTLAVQKFLAPDPRPGRAGHGQGPARRRRALPHADGRPGPVDGPRPPRAGRRPLDTAPPGAHQASATKPDAEATTSVPPASRYPKKLRRQELPTQAFQDIKSIQSSLDNFQVILTPPSGW